MWYYWLLWRQILCKFFRLKLSVNYKVLIYTWNRERNDVILCCYFTVCNSQICNSFNILFKVINPLCGLVTYCVGTLPWTHTGAICFDFFFFFKHCCYSTSNTSIYINFAESESTIYCFITLVQWESLWIFTKNVKEMFQSKGLQIVVSSGSWNK